METHTYRKLYPGIFTTNGILTYAYFNVIIQYIASEDPAENSVFIYLFFNIEEISWRAFPTPKILQSVGWVFFK